MATVTSRKRKPFEGLSVWDRWEWQQGLRKRGVTAAHPDDGWVNREENKLHLAYPHFVPKGGLAEGDLLALGYAFADTRIVRVTGFSENVFAGDSRWYVHFDPEEVECLPPFARSD